MSNESITVSDGTASDIALHSANGAGSLVKRRGRKPAQFWVSFTALDEPYKVISAPCRHCFATVSYHKKWEQAKSHLMRCEPFLKYVQTLNASQRPPWLVVELEKRRRSTSKLLPLNLLHNDEEKTEYGDVTAASRPSGDENSKTAKPIQSSELLLLQAMRTGAKIDVELIQHVLNQGAGGHRDEAMAGLVDRAVERVQRGVRQKLSASLEAGFASLLVAWDERKTAISYWIATEETSFFMETRRVPEHNDPVDWLHQDTARAAQSLEGSTSHVVVDAPLEWVEQLKARHLDEPKLQFRPSPRRVMETIVRELLEAGDDDSGGPLEGWLAHGLACQDVLAVVGLSGRQDRACEWFDDVVRLVAGTTRTISLLDALHALLDVERCLDITSFRDSLMELTHLDEAGVKRVCDVVSNAVFTAKLQQILAVIKPLSKALAELSKPIVQASDVIVAFAAMQRSLKEDAALSDTHTDYVFKVIEKYAHVFHAGEYALPHLLDPVYLGEYLDDKTKRDTEHELLLRAGEMDEEKQALYSEYTAFQIASIDQRVHADGFVYRMLKERKKTLLQYWMTDGHRWPRLQAVVLKVEKVPANAKLPRPILDDWGVSCVCDASKIAYMRTNAPRLSLADLLIEDSGV